MSEELNPFKIAQKQLDIVADKLKLDKATHALLREPMRTLIVTIPVRMDNHALTRIYQRKRLMLES